MTRRPIRVCYPFIGDEIGGSHISALKLVRHLNRDIVEPVIVLHDGQNVLAEFIRREEMDFIVAPKVATLSPAARRGSRGTSWGEYAFNTVPQLRRFLRSHEIDIVHTNDGQIHSTWAVPARLAGAKLVWHHRADPEARGVNILAPLLANHIVTVSNFSRPRRPIVSVTRKLSVVYSPFEHPGDVPDRMRSRDAILSELGCPPDTRLVGYFGGLIDRKRPVGFVDIVAAFKMRYPKIGIMGLLFGEPAPGGPNLDLAVKSRADELGISDSIKLMGFRRPIDRYMVGVDVNLVPAISEPFGRTLIESMMLGTPIIATNHGGNPEAITDGKTGFLVEPENPEAFVEPIHALLTDRELWQRISAAARHDALSRFSVEYHVDSITRIYKSLAGR